MAARPCYGSDRLHFDAILPRGSLNRGYCGRLAKARTNRRVQRAEEERECARRITKRIHKYTAGVRELVVVWYLAEKNNINS